MLISKNSLLLRIFVRMLGEILVGNKESLNEVEEAFIRSIPHFLIRNFDAELKAFKKNFFIRLEDGTQEKVYPPFTEFETTPEEGVEEILEYYLQEQKKAITPLLIAYILI